MNHQDVMLSNLYKVAPKFDVDNFTVGQDLFLTKLGILITATEQNELKSRIEIRKRGDNRSTYCSVVMSQQQRLTLMAIADQKAFETHRYDVSIRKAYCKVLHGKNTANLRLELVESNTKITVQKQTVIIPFEVVPSFQATTFIPSGNLVPVIDAKTGRITHGKEVLKGNPMSLRVQFAGAVGYQVDIPQKGPFAMRSQTYKSVQEFGYELVTSSFHMGVCSLMTVETLEMRVKHLTKKLEIIADHRGESISSSELVTTSLLKLKNHEEFGI